MSQESQPKDTQSGEERDRERVRDDDQEDVHSSTTLRKKEPKLVAWYPRLRTEEICPKEIKMDPNKPLYQGDDDGFIRDNNCKTIWRRL